MEKRLRSVSIGNTKCQILKNWVQYLIAYILGSSIIKLYYTLCTHVWYTGTVNNSKGVPTTLT